MIIKPKSFFYRKCNLLCKKKDRHQTRMPGERQEAIKLPGLEQEHKLPVVLNYREFIALFKVSRGHNNYGNEQAKITTGLTKLAKCEMSSPAALPAGPSVRLWAGFSERKVKLLQRQCLFRMQYPSLTKLFLV